MICLPDRQWSADQRRQLVAWRERMASAQSEPQRWLEDAASLAAIRERHGLAGADLTTLTQVRLGELLRPTP